MQPVSSNEDVHPEIAPRIDTNKLDLATMPGSVAPPAPLFERCRVVYGRRRAELAGPCSAGAEEP